MVHIARRLLSGPATTDHSGRTTHVDLELVMESDHDTDRDVGPDNAESSSNRSRQAQDLSDVNL